MDFKRFFSAIIGFPIVAVILIFGDKYLVDICISVIAMMSLHEYFHSFKEQSENKDLRWIAYILALGIACIHLIPTGYALKTIATVIPIAVLVLFAQVIASDMKYNVKDIMITVFGICYIVVFLMYVPIIREMQNGKIIIWYLFITAWGTDVFAYLVGKKIRKT